MPRSRGPRPSLARTREGRVQPVRLPDQMAAGQEIQIVAGIRDKLTQHDQDPPQIAISAVPPQKFAAQAQTGGVRVLWDLFTNHAAVRA